VVKDSIILIDALTEQVGTGTEMSGNPTHQELASYCVRLKEWRSLAAVPKLANW